MDSGLKERLVGAAVLVVLGVWLIPWLLNGPEPQSSVADDTDALVLPPAQDSGAVQTRTETIVLADDSRRGEPRLADSGSTSPAVTGTAATSAPAVADNPASRPGSVSQTGRPSAAAVSPPATRADSAAVAQVAAAAPAGADVAGGWVVQLGSFSDESNAGRLAGRVSTFGYSADVTTYRSGGRTLHRVRIGPWETRAEAEATASSLGAHGFVAQVVGAD